MILVATPHPLLTVPSGTGSPSPVCGELLQSTDWAATDLGAAQDWPTSLRTAVSICLNSRFPMFVWWGPSLVNIYNDAYIPVLGKRHPHAFGGQARSIWQDIWEVVGPQQVAVMERGEATWNERVLLVMERNGYTEDTWFTWSYSPIYREDGRIGGLFCACTEETATVKAERERDRLIAQAQDTARTLQTWFDNAPGFIALLRGPDHVLEMVNRAYYQLVGHREILGKPVAEALPEIRSQGFNELMDQVYESAQPFIGRAVPVRIQKSPGAPLVERFIDLVYQPVYDAQGRVTGIFAQGHDVTEQVQATLSLKAADQRKDEFLATLAHELRNPLAPIGQAAQLAGMSQASPEQRAWALALIQRQTRHMALLIDDLLDVARISQGKLVLRLQPVDLREVVNGALETARPALDSRGHALLLDLPDAPVRVHADPVRLAQVLSNLLSNAAKYTDRGGRIELRVEQRPDEVLLRVKDNGIGLSAQDRARVFGMFAQVHSAIDRAEGGLGIGLALSRGLMGLHGGRIEVHSEGPGRGSEFIAILPAQTAGDAPVPAREDGERKAPRQPTTIVLADDNRDALDTLAMLLQAYGHEVHTATDGEQALEAIRRVHPQVAVLDIGMPRMNGYDVARQLRREGLAGLRLIALTGWGQAQDQARAREAGFDHHCTKPVDLEGLLELVERRATAPEWSG
jgi:signal transduction histidine kinase/CheY-like chemotaxis protein